MFVFRDPFWVVRGQCFIFGARICARQSSGLIHKHIVKHSHVELYIIVKYRENYQGSSFSG